MWGYILRLYLRGYILGLYWDNGKQSGNYYVRFRVSLVFLELTSC